jgi:hypothetical protein
MGQSVMGHFVMGRFVMERFVCESIFLGMAQNEAAYTFFYSNLQLFK